MAALILPGQYASWQTGLIEAFIPERTLGDYTVAGGMLKSMSMQGPAVTITGNQHLYKRLATGFNYPLTIVVVHRQIVASPSRVMASVGAGTNRHLLYLSSSGGVSMYSGSSGGGVQAAGAGTVAGSINFSAGRVAASNYRDVFINGQFSAPNTGNIITGPQNTFAIGAYWNNDAAATNFYSDEEVLFAGLWNRALSNAEILALHRSWDWIKRPKRQSVYFLPADTGGGGAVVGNASGALAGLSLSESSAGASGAAQAASAMASISVAAANATAGGAAQSSAALQAITISPATASASGGAAIPATATAALAALSVSPASASASGGASIPATASASLSSLIATPAQASASGAATAAGPMLGINLTPAQAQATAAAWAAAELAAVGLTPATATASDGAGPVIDWTAPGSLAIVPKASVLALVPEADLAATIPAADVRAIVPLAGDDMDIIKTFDHQVGDTEIYELAYGPKYIDPLGDTPSTLAAFNGGHAGIASEVSVGGASGATVKFAVDGTVPVGSYTVSAQLATAAGRKKTAAVLVKVEA